MGYSINKMKKVLFAVFAHPDDEAFGPSATIIKEVQAGAELHLVCATRGEGGMNVDNHADLGAVRLKEWQKAADMMGATACHNLEYADGTLCNQTYHKIAQKVETLIREACARADEPLELCLMTFDTNGLTGHLDHIAISYITTFVFYRLKARPPARTTVRELAYFCISDQQEPEPDLDYFVFMPAGRPQSYINRRVAVQDLLEQKFAVMRVHHTQRTDAAQFMARGEAFHATDNFHVIN